MPETTANPTTTAPENRPRPTTRRAAILAGAALLAASSLGCGDTSSGLPPASPGRLVALHAEPDPVAGGRVVDAEGREILLRGANVNALADYWKGIEFPTVFPFTEADADRMSEIGWTAMRLLISWSRVEPSPGEYDEAYLDEVDAAVRTLASRGLYTVIDLHQDAWGATLAARPDEVCPPGSKRAIGWDGAPGWATLDGDAPRCAAAGIRETSQAVRASWTAFWSDAAGPGGVGIRTRYVRMLAHLAARWAGRAEVAGFDLMNEPNAFGDDEQRRLSEMYGEAVAAMRAAERAAGAPPHLVFFEPSALWSANGRGAPPDFARDRDVVYAPHVYTGGFTGGPITAAAFEVAAEEARGFGGAPVFSGEWGGGPERASDPADGYFVRHQALQDEFRFGATLWTWRESCGDPHKSGPILDGEIPGVWGEFEVDCRTNEILGERTDLLDDLTRALLRAAPGRIERATYDEAGATFEAAGADAPAGAELVAFWPSGKHGAPALAGSGLDDLRAIAGPGAQTWVVGRARGGAWSVSASGNR